MYMILWDDCVPFFHPIFFSAVLFCLDLSALLGKLNHFASFCLIPAIWPRAFVCGANQAEPWANRRPAFEGLFKVLKW